MIRHEGPIAPLEVLQDEAAGLDLGRARRLQCGIELFAMTGHGKMDAKDVDEVGCAGGSADPHLTCELRPRRSAHECVIVPGSEIASQHSELPAPRSPPLSGQGAE